MLVNLSAPTEQALGVEHIWEYAVPLRLLYWTQNVKTHV